MDWNIQGSLSLHRGLGGNCLSRNFRHEEIRYFSVFKQFQRQRTLLCEKMRLTLMLGAGRQWRSISVLQRPHQTSFSLPVFLSFCLKLCMNFPWVPRSVGDRAGSCRASSPSCSSGPKIRKQVGGMEQMVRHCYQVAIEQGNELEWLFGTEIRFNLLNFQLLSVLIPLWSPEHSNKDYSPPTMTHPVFF